MANSNLINEMFNRVKFDDNDREFHKCLYDNFKGIALIVDLTITDCPEKTLAFRRMQEALMYFGAALARDPKYHENK